MEGRERNDLIRHVCVCKGRIEVERGWKQRQEMEEPVM